MKTLVCLMCEMGLGLLDAMYGPMLLRLQQQVHTEFGNISYVVTARGLGHVLGCLVCEYYY